MTGSPIAWILALATFGLGQDVPPVLTVAAKLQSKSAYVGQAVELQAAVVAGTERPRIEPPKIIGADLAFIGQETQAISVSAIGDQVNEQTVHRFRYRLVPRKVGTIVIPPFSAQLAKRRGASQPLNLEARELPREGRTGDFLGGVGTFELSATAKPSTIRLGQDLEYRIKVKGTAARGMREGPSLERLVKANPGIRVEKLPEESIDEPPSRVFTWRIRPRSSGELHLTPVSISAFDPKIGLYSTKATAGIVIKVADVPLFDPKTINYGPVSGDGREPVEGIRPRAWPIALFGLMISLAVGAALWHYRRTRVPNDARRILIRFQRRLRANVDRAEIGPLINQAVKDYLIQRQVHSTGALTPNEAKMGVERLTSSPLGSRAEELLAESDRLCFGAEGGDEDGLRIKQKALRFFEDLITAEIGSLRVNSPSEPVQP